MELHRSALKHGLSPGDIFHAVPPLSVAGRRNGKVDDNHGEVLTDAAIEELAAEVESTDYDVNALKQRRRGRPAMGAGPAEVVPVRIDPGLRAAMEARAKADHTTTSEIIREALRRYLEVA